MNRIATTTLLLILGLPALGFGPVSPSASAGTTRLAGRADMAMLDAVSQEDSSAPVAVQQKSLDGTFSTYELLDLDLPALKSDSESQRRITLRLAGVDHELVLAPYELRAAGFRSTITTASGIVDEPVGPIATYSGTVTGQPGSDVRLLIEDDLVVGYVRTATDCLFIEPAAMYDKTMPTNFVVVYRDADVRPEHRGECGTMRLAAHAGDFVGQSDSGGAKTRDVVRGGDSLTVIEIATDADQEYAALHPSTNAFIRGIILQVDGIYQTELNITFRITFQNAWTRRDPYTSSKSSKLLGQFRSWANTTWYGLVRRDVAHLFTGKDLENNVVGRAFTEVVCSNTADSYAYGLSSDLSNSSIVKCVSHELGHNFGSKAHDDKRTPPVDDCNGDGPIMCSGIQGRGANVFSSASKDDILDHLDSNSFCLDTIVINPTAVPADYDGDGKADLSLKTDDGFWLIDFASTGFGGAWEFQLTGRGSSGFHPVPADYDGDGKDDVSVKVDDGRWLIDYSSIDYFVGFDVALEAYGFTDVTPVPADYDGDGRADLSVKVTDGRWYIDYASNGFGAWDVGLQGYGFENAHPVPADYDGDGKADLSVKADDGFWLIDYAVNGFGTWDVEFAGYGSTNGHPVPADYDGDGMADLSVKTDEGYWFIDYASNGFGQWNVVLEAYGFANAHPVPADYDGDGKADLSVKVDDGFWLIDFAANGFGAWDREIPRNRLQVP